MPPTRKPTMGTMTSRPQASVVCMGGTGTGKTTFVNLAGGSNFQVGDDLESCTDRVQPYRFTLDDYDVTLVDLPGFDDTNKSDSDLLIMIANYLSAEYKKGRTVNGILYFHRISDVRVGGTSKRNFTMFKKLCGEDVFSNVAIVTTRWDQENEGVANKRLEELKSKPQLFKTVIDGGAEIFKHDHRSEESGRKIIRHLINKAPKALLIQREMAEGKQVLETSAGQELQREIMERTEKHQKEMAELLEEMEQTRDESGIEELEEELRALRDKMARVQAESLKLAGIPHASEPEPSASGEIHPATSDSPLNSSFVVTDVSSTSEQPHELGTKTAVPGEGEGERLEAAIGGLKEELREIGMQLKQERLQREGDQRRLDEIEKKLVRVVIVPSKLLALVDRVLTMFPWLAELKRRITS